MTGWLLVALAAWPGPDAAVHAPALPTQRAGTPRLKVLVDAGHGAPGNEGNHGCFCQLEQDHTLRVSSALAAGLVRTGRFDVRESRTGAQRPGYQARLDAAQAWGADVVVSLHSDSRGVTAHWSPFGDQRQCLYRAEADGFAVLWSEEGATDVVAGRARLGQALAARLVEAGFPAYDGADYVELYRGDPGHPGTWVDVRPPGKRVFFLRHAAVPTVIIETHHAMDPAEVARWDEPATLEAFVGAIAAGLSDLAASR